MDKIFESNILIIKNLGFVFLQEFGNYLQVLIFTAHL